LFENTKLNDKGNENKDDKEKIKHSLELIKGFLKEILTLEGNKKNY
jgi:hypothetical protein